MDTTHRFGEDGAVPFRANRFFTVGTRWYFSTREGIDNGPYATRERANDGLRNFLRIAQMIPAPTGVDHNQFVRNHSIY